MTSPWPPSSDRGDRFPGNDRHAELHPAAPGRLDTRHLDPTPRVAVVGGGIAGITAATALAERGVGVTVLEREDDLGGRVRGWTTTQPDGSHVTMTRGFHAFFRQYYNLRSLLRRIDPHLDLLRPIADYPLLHRNGTRESFAKLPSTPPWNVVSFVLRSDTFAIRDLVRMNAMDAMALFDVSVPATYDALDFLDAATFLRGIRFPDAARHLAFEVFSRSFFAHPSALSAAELATMFHIYFLGSSEGLLFDVPADPYPVAIWSPLRVYLDGLGADVRTGVAVDRVVPGADRRYRVEATNPVHGEFDAVVLATDTPGLRAIVERSERLGDPAWRRSVRTMRTAPPFLVSRFWLDTPVRADRAPFLGTSGFRYLDNISVLDRFEGEAASWRKHSGGSVVELHAYALNEDHDREAVIAAMTDEAHSVYPEIRRSVAIHQEHVVRSDCPLFAPGGFATRPTVSTPDPFLALAGDHVRIDLPVALMERAATSGFQAANVLLRRWGVHGHGLWTVPNRGRSSLLRRVARRSTRGTTGTD